MSELGEIDMREPLLFVLGIYAIACLIIIAAVLGTGYSGIRFVKHANTDEKEKGCN